MVNRNLQATEEKMDTMRTVLRQQEAMIQMLDAALLALGATQRPAPAEWMVGLNPQQRALMGALHAVYPRTLERYQLLELLPSKRGDELDRHYGIVNVIICKTRKVLGYASIYNDRGFGYRMGDEFYRSIETKELDAAA